MWILFSVVATCTSSIHSSRMASSPEGAGRASAWLCCPGRGRGSYAPTKSFTPFGLRPDGRGHIWHDVRIDRVARSVRLQALFALFNLHRIGAHCCRGFSCGHKLCFHDADCSNVLTAGHAFGHTCLGSGFRGIVFLCRRLLWHRDAFFAYSEATQVAKENKVTCTATITT